MSKRLEVFQKMVAAGSKDPMARYALAMELKSLGRLEESLVAFADLRAFDGAYVAQYLMAGGVAEALSKRDEARGLYEEGTVRARAKGDDHALSELQQALSALGEPTS
jgi:tetratricopeptide (TPR) repeat protein